jgi:F0F1-type ATP synthase delta subunit
LVFITLKGRLSILGNVIGSFDSMYLESTHQMRTQVKTAFEMKDKDKKFIDKVLQDKFHQKVMTNWTIDPSLIGGFRIFAQGKLYDYSFKDQLDSFLQLTT